MFVIPNQSSVPTAWKAFTSASDAEATQIGVGNRDRVVDVCEELLKFTCLMRGQETLFSDRYSERKEKIEHGKLLTQAQKDSMAQEDKVKKVCRLFWCPNIQFTILLPSGRNFDIIGHRTD